MRIRECALVLLLTPAVAEAQPLSLASLRDADSAFADALLRHDRAAFLEMLAPDAECTFPTAKRGRTLIADAWMIFFIDPGTTMILSRSDVATAEDRGTSWGSLAVRGRTANGVQTVPAGTYALEWRVIAGQWKVSRLGGSAKAARRVSFSDGNRARVGAKLSGSCLATPREACSGVAHRRVNA